MNKSKLAKHTAVMTAVNLIMRSASVGFNAYLTSKIGSAGMGLFQLVITVYSLAVTFSCAGIKLAATRIIVESEANGKNDIRKTLKKCLIYAFICGSAVGLILYMFSDFISIRWLSSAQTASLLRILSGSLPFVAMSAALGGYFTAREQIPQYSTVQMLEQGIKIIITVFLLNRFSAQKSINLAIAIVMGMTAAEVASFSMSYTLKSITAPLKTDKNAAKLGEILRIAIPDASGTSMRSILLTIEHLLIPKGFEKSGEGSAAALSAYGNIHGMALPVLLYPSAVISSLSSLMVPDLARKNELGDKDGINRTVEKNLLRTLLFSLACALVFAFFAPALSNAVYKSNEAVMYIRILSPLVPIMYMDTVTDGMLKGLDQQLYSMRYNIIDSALCVGMVYFLLPKYSVKGYIFILYASEIINFYLSFNRLIAVCDITCFRKIKALRERQEDIPIPFSQMKYSAFQPEYEYQKGRGRAKRSQVR